MVRNYVRDFRNYGIEFFGEIPMERISDAEVLEAIAWAFNMMHTRTVEEGTVEPSAVRELFLNHLFEKYI